MTAVSRTLIWALVVVLAGAAGFFAYRFTQEPRSGLRPVTDAEPARSVPAQPTEVDPDSAPVRKVPDRLPEFTLADMDGRERQLSHWSDRPLLVNFWATWCEPCRREIPLLKKLRAQHTSDRLEVIGIAVDFRDAVLKYANEMNIDYPLLIGEQEGLEAIETFGMEPVFPFSVFADRRSRIVAIRVGELHEDEADFILTQVREIDAGRLDLAEAKQRISAQLRDLAVKRATHPGTG